MAQATGTYSSYDGVGLREDLDNEIHNIDPYETPFYSKGRKKKVKAKYHEWQTDTLEASEDNAQIEGDEYSYAAPSATTRVGNYTQIFREEIIVSGTMEAVDKAGRKSELAYQLAKKGKKLKKDIEKALLNNNASVAGNDTTARELGGFPAWITTNDSRGGTGADGGFSGGIVAAATDGTQRAFTETLLKAVLKSQYDNGGKADMLSLGSFNKQAFSAFTGISELRTNYAGSNKGQAAIIAGADFYISDFGTVTVVLNREQRARDALLIDRSMYEIGTLRPMFIDKPAKTGDAHKRVLLCEKTLIVNNEKAHGHVADLTTS